MQWLFSNIINVRAFTTITAPVPHYDLDSISDLYNHAPRLFRFLSDVYISTIME